LDFLLFLLCVFSFIQVLGPMVLLLTSLILITDYLTHQRKSTYK